MASVRAQRITGGIAGLVLAFSPALLLALVRFDGRALPHLSVFEALLLVAGLGQAASPHGLALQAHVGSFHFDWGQTLAEVPALLAIALIAPMVSYRRRDALLFLVPGVNVWIVWVISSRAAVFGSWVLGERKAANSPDVVVAARRRKATTTSGKMRSTV